MSPRDLKSLADGVRERRTELGLSLKSYAARAGEGEDSLSTKTLQRIEKERIAEPRSKTLGALDRAGGWQTGTARALLEGRPAPAAPDMSRPEPRPEEYPDRLEYFVAQFEHLHETMDWSEDVILNGFETAAKIYLARKLAERDAQSTRRDKLG